MPNLLINEVLLNKYAGKEQKATIAKSLGTVAIKDSFDYQKVYLNPSWNKVFRERKKYHVVLTFLDVTGFSTHTRHMTPPQIVDFLDRYYSIVVPVIYKNGGVIEKIIGDGIISIFGPPFISNESLELLLRRAETFARLAMLNLRDEGIGSKCALHHGEVMYYSTVGTVEEYVDLTIVGEPITELFRLESASEDGYISYFDGTYYSNLVQEDLNRPKDPGALIGFRSDSKKEVELQGIGRKTILTLRPV